jgi:L-galactose dehydrogenase/L-glyceraldehyde 3-phosphate reductase
MDYRVFGKTGFRISTLGFGCGNVGGLMVRGAPADQERAVARAMDLGINYFDTAPSYGDGQSEQNLGRVLRTLRAQVTVGTKFRLTDADERDIAGGVTRSLEASLKRLGLDRVDLLQCHNPINLESRPRGGDVTAARLLGDVVPALDRLRQQGKIRWFGITALGDTRALHQAIDAGVLYTAQVCVNLLNPTASVDVPPGFPAQDFGQLLRRTRRQEIGTIGIRAFAAGALSGETARHPIAVPEVDPIASGPDYSSDVERARRFRVLVDEGHAGSLVEAALRFVISDPGISTVLLGYSSGEHLEQAAAAVAKGPLPAPALARLQALWKDLASGAR